MDEAYKHNEISEWKNILKMDYLGNYKQSIN